MLGQQHGGVADPVGFAADEDAAAVDGGVGPGAGEGVLVDEADDCGVGEGVGDGLVVGGRGDGMEGVGVEEEGPDKGEGGVNVLFGEVLLGPRGGQEGVDAVAGCGEAATVVCGGKGGGRIQKISGRRRGGDLGNDTGEPFRRG